MRKFINLLRKEVKELITFQLIISLVFTFFLFLFMGDIMKREMKKASSSQTIYILDLDNSSLSKKVINNLAFFNFKISLLEKKDKEEAIEYARKSNISLLLVIPRQFEDSILKFKGKDIETYSFIKSFSVAGTSATGIVNYIISAINRVISDDLLKSKVPNIDPQELKNPVKNKEFVVVKDKIAQGSPQDVLNFVYSQSVFLPIILMMIIVYSSQMVISAMAMEKENKTLETLLTVPINRRDIVLAKMLSSGIVGLISAGIYMIGFRNYMGEFVNKVPTATQLSMVIQELGLSLTVQGYIILGISLFLAILCALSMAIILGVLAEDLKTAQGLIILIIFPTMVPYFLSIFSDINSLSLPAKIIVWLIPFSHPFLALQNILLGNYIQIFYGIFYMTLVFAILVIIATRIFSSDRILIMKLQFRRLRRLRR
ncbi:MAG: ABC transporter permease [bacterium]